MKYIMEVMMKKKICLFLVLVLTVCMFAGCAQEGGKDASSSAEQVSAEKKTVELTDQNGRTVTVEYPVERIACMQHHSLDILTQLGAQEQIVCTEDKWMTDLGSYMKDVFPGIEELPTAGTLSDPNVEAIAALDPDLVILAAQCNEDAVAQFEKLGIPAIVVSLRGEGKQAEAQNPNLSDADAAYTEGLQWAVETLGMLSGREDKADELWKFAMESRSYVEEQLSDISEDERVRVFIANENNQTYGDDKYVGCMLLRAGGVNVAAEDISGYKEYSIEQLYNWDPEIIIVQDRYPQVYEEITTDEKYKELSAVKNGKVILAPYWTKPFGNPDSDSVALGELWMAHQFYPDKISADYVEKRAQEFYKNFYGTDFTGSVE